MLNWFEGENTALAGKAGAVDAVVAAINAHVGNASMMENGKKLLDAFGGSR